MMVSHNPTTGYEGTRHGEVKVMLLVEEDHGVETVDTIL